jgi:hypothetical protein
MRKNPSNLVYLFQFERLCINIINEELSDQGIR